MVTPPAVIGDEAPLWVSREGGVARLTLNRPERLNAIDLDLAGALLDASLACAHDSDVRAVLLDGTGRSFCAGGDLASFAEQGADLPRHLREVTARLHAALSTLRRMDAPIVVAVHGAAAGAGLGLACAGDVVLAAPSARFAFAYTSIGLSPDAGTSWLLPRLVGARCAAEMALEGRALTAVEAEKAGLVTRVVPEEALAREATEGAAQLAAGPTLAYAAAMRLFAAGWRRSFDEQLAAESEQLSRLATTDDAREGIASFLTRRTPSFRRR